MCINGTKEQIIVQRQLLLTDNNTICLGKGSLGQSNFLLSNI